MQINTGNNTQTPETKRVYVDTLPANQLTIVDFIQLTANGYTLVTTNTVCDIAAFQDNPEAFREMVENGSVVIERWLDPDAMTSKKFYWSSCSIETEPADSFEAAIATLPNKDGITAVTAIMMELGLAKGEWPQGEWSPPAPMDDEVSKILGISKDATRTEVFGSANAAGRKDIFDEYNLGYCKGLAIQHKCNYMLNSDGSVTKI